MFSYIASELFPMFCGAERVRTMTWKEWISVSVPCGFVTSGDVGLSNLSLVTISMTFYTMVKSSTPIFVLMWAYLFGIERITWNLCFVVLIIAFGEVLTVVGEVDFHPVGFALCLTASVLSGARWTLVQLKLRQMEPPLKTTIVTMRLLAPSMFWSMLFVSLCIEHPWIRLQDRPVRVTLYDLFGLGMVGATLAICMILCEFWLIMKSNAIVLMIGGVLKEMITIFAGVIFFGDELNSINLSGCFVVFVGVVYYKVTHFADAKPHHRRLEDDDIGNNNLNSPNRENARGSPSTNILLDRSLSPRVGRVTLRTNATGSSSSDGIVLYSKISTDSDSMTNLDDSLGTNDRMNGSSTTTTITTTTTNHHLTNNRRLDNTRSSNIEYRSSRSSRILETGESTAETASINRKPTGTDIC
jgi:solute carrier family 35, member C2